MRNETAKLAQKLKCQKNVRGHTDLNHGPIGLQPIALPLSYIPLLAFHCKIPQLPWLILPEESSIGGSQHLCPSVSG